jgi:HSP20 family protein
MSNSPADAALRNLEKMISRDPLLRDILNPSMPTAKRPARFSPDVDVVEADDGYHLVLEVPGVDRASMAVEVDGTKLIVRGEKLALRPEGRVRVSERVFGAFKREFLLPFQVATEGIKASLDNGVLVVEVPRTGGTSPRVVPIDMP